MAWLVPFVPIAAAALLLPGMHPPDRAPHRPRLAAWGAGAMVATAATAVLAALGGWTGEIAWSGTLVLRLDYGLGSAPASALFAVLVPTVAAPVLAYAAIHEHGRGLRRLLVLLAVAVAAMELVAGAADLLVLLVGWEIIGACSAVLVGHEWWEEGKARAGAAVLLTTRSGDLGLFLACAAAFAGAGSLAYGDLATLGGPHLGIVVGGILVAAAAKSAQLPFAPWLFSAMEGPVPVSTLLHAAAMVASGAFLLIRLHPLLEGVAWFGPAAMAVGLTTALLAGAVALLQPHAKRLLAGSTSAHYGLMFVAVGAGYPAIAALHLVAHAFAKAPLFLATGIARAYTGSYRLRRMGLRRALPTVAVASLVAAAAIGGLPPLGGGWTKEKVVTAAGHSGAWVALLAALAGGLSAAYMARFHLQAFGSTAGGHEGRVPREWERWPVLLLAAVTVALGFLWIPSAHTGAARLLDGTVPSLVAWELVLSLALVGIGLATGVGVARGRPGLGESGAAAAVGDWLGLPALARVGVVRPVQGLARGLARFDDRMVDGGVRVAVALGSRLSGAAGRFDERVVDGGVRATTRLTGRLASLGRRFAEALFDALPEETADWIGRAGAGSRRLQTGLAHHYYALVMAGLGIVIVLLYLGG